MLSLAPRRAANGRPRARSRASGPTKGTSLGSDAMVGVNGGRDITSQLVASEEAEIGELLSHFGRHDRNLIALAALEAVSYTHLTLPTIA